MIPHSQTFERNPLHRETKRTLHATDTTGITITRWRDSLGRLGGINLEQLSAQAHVPAPQILIGQITNRQYHYDALGQITAIETPSQLLRYGYDQAGRLRAMADSLKPEQTIRWDLDPAGNRLPGKTASGQPQQPDWAEQVHRSWRQHEFNLLGQGQAGQISQDPVTKWQDNRIGYHGGSVWRYDQCGNRIEQVSQHSQGYRRQYLSYDGAHQLTAVRVEGIDQQGNVTVLSASRYIYDALGRRLKKSVKDETGKEHISYFGWDGDRLVHTERMKDDGTRDIEHIVHESGTFTPLIRLSTTVKGDPQAKPHLLAQAAKAVVPGQQKDSLSTTHALQGLQGAMSGMPEAMRKMMEQSMKQALGGGLTDMSKSIMRGMGIDPDALIGTMNREIEEERQREQTKVEVQFFHCDHLGTPIALTDRQGNIVWAVKHDPWGNIEEEFNPHGIGQDVRLPGQHHDRETGLYYNLFRYYDPKIGSYINQDPIGWMGGINHYEYPNDPLEWIDPLGLLGRVGRQSTRSYKPPKPKPNNPPKYPPNPNKAAEGQKKLDSKRKWYEDAWSGFKDFLTQQGSAQRIDEALVCTQEQNTETKEIRKPYDVIVDENGVGVIRTPSPSEIDPPYTCVKSVPRKMPDEPPPGL